MTSRVKVFGVRADSALVAILDAAVGPDVLGISTGEASRNGQRSWVWVIFDAALSAGEVSTVETEISDHSPDVAESYAEEALAAGPDT